MGNSKFVRGSSALGKDVEDYSDLVRTVKPVEEDAYR